MRGSVGDLDNKLHWQLRRLHLLLLAGLNALLVLLLSSMNHELLQLLKIHLRHSLMGASQCLRLIKEHDTV